MMFVVSEVHPFADGNGRSARVAMNAELVPANLHRMIIPTVLRNDYTSALTSASHYLARELGGDGIRVNTVLPGFKWGARLQHTVPLLAKQLGIEPEELIERFRARLALYRFADDESVANASVFFCSEYAKNITGQQLVVDGGGLLH